MTIGPVGSSPPFPEPPSPETQVRSDQARPRSRTESVPAQENAKPKNTTPVPAIPEDEVKVQWDTPMSDYIVIYQFLNQQSGSLILQEPSEQMLSVIHQIQELLRSTARAAATLQPGR
jgi:hypothetical protein